MRAPLLDQPFSRGRLSARGRLSGAAPGCGSRTQCNAQILQAQFLARPQRLLALPFWLFRALPALPELAMQI